jgi:hypothetical protein
MVVETRVFMRVSAECLTGVPNRDGGFADEVDIIPPQSCELALAHPGSEREGYQGLVSRVHSGP